MKLCRGRDSMFYRLKHPPEVSVGFITLYSFLLGLQLRTADIPGSSLRVRTAVPVLRGRAGPGEGFVVATAAMAARPALPDSVLVRVLALLPLRDRLRAARVCRRWQQLAQDRAVWTHVDLSPHRISRRTLWHLVRHRLPDSLSTLRMRGAPRSGGKQRLLSPALLAALRKRCPQLHRLCLTETDLRHVPYESMPASVTTLELSLCDIPDAWFCVSPSVPPPQNHLKTLSLCGTYRVTDMGIQAAAPHLEELERLTLRHCIIGDAAMVFIGRHMKQLRYLEISNAYFLTNRGLVAIVTLEHLETLCLDLYDLVSLGTVIALLQVLPRLSHLKLGGTCFEDELLGKIQQNFPHCTISHSL